jgi:hypothetical protein
MMLAPLTDLDGYVPFLSERHGPLFTRDFYKEWPDFPLPHAAW